MASALRRWGIALPALVWVVLLGGCGESPTAPANNPAPGGAGPAVAAPPANSRERTFAQEPKAANKIVGSVYRLKPVGGDECLGIAVSSRAVLAPKGVLPAGGDVMAHASSLGEGQGRVYVARSFATAFSLKRLEGSDERFEG